METAPHRLPGISLLRGSGLEIGALHQPFPLPPGAAVRYVDAITPEYAREFFPEIDPSLFVALDRIVELDREGLGYLPDRSLDFVIMSHVIEHLANPTKAVQEAFRVLAPGGRLLIAVPDRDFTFDRHRLPTSFEHLWDDYEKGVTENSDHHYIDFLKSAAPHVFLEPEEKIIGHIRYSRLRREHAHVWTSRSFREFMVKILDLLGYKAEPLYESSATENQFEYFGVWERRG
jgi:SAM-dependent methyltransferase